MVNNCFESQENNKVLITYWLPKISEKFDNIHSTIKIQPFNSLEQLDTIKCPEIPIDAVNMEFEIILDKNDSDVTDNFFESLLQP